MTASQHEWMLAYAQTERPVESEIVMHDACKPGEKMCFLCEQILTQSHSNRGFLSALRWKHPASIQVGSCLNCGHAKHERNLCTGRDFWDEDCACERFIKRAERSRARASS